MSLFKNQNNDFEKKLRDQLDETEFKPSDSLWNRIDQEVNKPEFEKKVEGKIGNYQLDPKKETWEQIEAQLPPEPKGINRRKYLWIPLTALLFISGLGIGFWLNQMENNSNILVINGNEQQVPTTSSFEIEPNNEAEVMSSNQVNTQNEASVKHIKSKQKELEVAENKSEPLISQTAKPTKKQIAPTQSTQTVNNTIQTLASGNGAKTNLPKSIISSNYSLNKKQIAPTQTANENKQPIVNGNGGTSGLTKNDVADNQNEKQITPTQILNKNEGIVQHQQTDKKQPNSNENQTGKNEPADVAQQQTKPSEPLTDTTKSVKNIIPALHDSVANTLKPEPNLVDEERPSKISLSIMMGAHYSQMHLYTEQTTLAKHVALRNQIESAKIDWSGAFLIDYQWKKMLISSGVQFTHFSMGMTYGTTQATQPPKYEPNSQVSTNDSVTANGINNTRIKYSWNEIPLLITCRFTPHKRLGVEAKVGVSYAFISTVDAALVGQNNVGVLVVKNKESFPFVKNSIFAQAYLGLAYQVNPAITITAMPYLRYSLNSMTDSKYAVKQHPYMVGMSIGLRKHF
ncbi:MAG: hypothetical protein ACK44D_02810 [Bacteroidia bacterium]